MINFRRFKTSVPYTVINLGSDVIITYLWAVVQIRRLYLKVTRCNIKHISWSSCEVMSRKQTIIFTHSLSGPVRSSMISEIIIVKETLQAMDLVGLTKNLHLILKHCSAKFGHHAITSPRVKWLQTFANPFHRDPEVTSREKQYNQQAKFHQSWSRNVELSCTQHTETDTYRPKHNHLQLNCRW